MLLAAGSFLSQMMLLVGMILLAWILVRRNIKMRKRGRAVDRQLRTQQAAVSQPPRGAPLADAPKEILRWQASMFDLQRELKADLDTRIAVVQALLRQVDQRVAELKSMQHAGLQSASEQTLTAGQFGKISQLKSIGFSADEISQKLSIPLADVELSLGSGGEIPVSSESV